MCTNSQLRKKSITNTVNKTDPSLSHSSVGGSVIIPLSFNENVRGGGVGVDGGGCDCGQSNIMPK
jgi:hypothetical protein